MHIYFSIIFMPCEASLKETERQDVCGQNNWMDLALGRSNNTGAEQMHRISEMLSTIKLRQIILLQK